MSYTKGKSYIVQNIDRGIWKITAGSCMYALLLGEPIIIDAGERKFRKDALFVEHVIDPRYVKKVIFTHLHYDHIGNYDIFPNAEFFAGEREIEALKADREGTILDRDMAEKFTPNLKPAESLKIPGLEIIPTPGHTKGSICIYLKEKQILFSGDTIFPGRSIGRTDLATSVPEEMPKSLARLLDYPFKRLCPGHDD